MMVAYIAQGLVWAAGGLILGFVLAIVAVRKGLLRGVTMANPERLPATEVGPDIPGPRDTGKHPVILEGAEERPFWRRGGFWLGAIVAGIGIFTMVTTAILGNRTAELQRCQQAYLIGFSDNLQAVRESSKAATDDLTKVIELVRTLRTAAPADAQAQFDRAVDDYLESRRRADQSFRDNPIRDPRDICNSL